MPQNTVHRHWSRDLVSRIVTLLVGALVLSTAAMGEKINTRHDRDADFTGLETYAWRPASKKTEGSPLEAGGEIDKLIHGILVEELERSGYRPAGEEDKADFEIAYDGFSETLVDDLATRREITPGVAWVVDGDYRSWEKGTLYLWIYLPDNKATAWTAWASGKRKADGPRADPKKVRRAVRKMLARFPPS